MTASATSRNILITGVSGLIGSALRESLMAKGFQVYALERRNSEAPFYCAQSNNRIELNSGIPLHAVVNLAGASIADGRWTKHRKDEIWNSRVRTTKLLCEALSQLPHKPELLISASAIGYYGNDCDEPADENSKPGEDFLARLSVAWEQATASAEQSGIRTVRLRFGLVLSADGGVLKNLVMPMKLAVVGRLGQGAHRQSWISITDALAIIERCIENKTFRGPLNGVAPEVVSNRDFARALSKALARPQLPPMPAPMVRLMFGELADAALLASANIQSKRLSELGIELQHPGLEEALRSIYH